MVLHTVNKPIEGPYVAKHTKKISIVGKYGTSYTVYIRKMVKKNRQHASSVLSLILKEKAVVSA